MEKWMEAASYTIVIKNLDMMVNLRMDCFMEMEYSMHKTKLGKDKIKLTSSMLKYSRAIG